MVTIRRDKIKSRIKELGYTYSGVARRAQMSVYTLQRWVSDETYGTPNKFARQRLAEVLEAPEEEFFGSVGADPIKAS
jgi:transcriptional regulator with XRE-family HTH domain